MLNLRGIRASVLAGLAGVGALACEVELTISPPPNPADAVVAQFDPTNPIPVLQIVPSPTSLAEVPGGDGRVNVPVQECEKPSTKQCLALVDGFPVTTPITLYFSGEIDEASLSEGITIVKAGTNTPIPFSAVVGPRPAPNAACADGGNGSNKTYDPDKDVPPGIQVVLRPNTTLEGKTRYFVYVKSHEADGAVHGLRTKDGKRVEPSNLFALLNAPDDHPPITNEGGTITLVNPLLRSNVVSLLLAQDKFGGKTSLADLTAEERAMFDADLAARSVSLLGLYTFFKTAIGAGVAAGIVTDRNALVFANTWQTGSAAPAGGEVLFDPLRQKVPFPNAQLLTTATSTRVTIPINPCGATPTPGCDSPSAAALKGGLNTLDGFSTTAPLSVPFSTDIDPATLEGNVLLYKLDAMKKVTGEAIPVILATKTATGAEDAALLIRPALPLDENSFYVVVLKKGIKGLDGNDIRRPQTFNFLTVRDPLVVDGVVNPDATVAFPGAPAPIAVEAVLQCSTVAATGMLAPDEQVNATAATIEGQLRRARWVEALDSLSTAPTAIDEDDILMAWTHKTQTITGTTDLIVRQLLPNAYPNVLAASGKPAIFGPIPTRTATTPQQVQGVLAVTLCQSGQLPLPMGFQCLVNGQPNPLLFQNATVQQLLALYSGRISTMRLYLMANYVITTGNPLGAGGTFTPNTVMQPRVVQTPIWVITPQGVAKAPVVIFQHGLGSLKESGFLIASTFAQAGYATVLMDLPFHGSRANDLVNNMTGAPCLAVNPDNVTCDPTTGACMNGCDGTPDSSGTGFLSSNVFAARDNFRQSTVDQMTLVRLIQSQSMAGGALEDLDGARIGYAGQSLGGITGANLAAYAPELSAAVLNVPGGGLVNILLTTVPQISGPLFAALTAAGVCTPAPGGGCKDNASFRQFTITAQTALDPGDPYATSIGVRNAHNMVPPLTPAKVLIQMAVPDLVIPNATTQALGRAYGFDPSDNSASSHYQTFNMMGTNCHAFILSPAGCTAPEFGSQALTSGLCASFGAQQQAARFIASGGQMVGARNPVGLSALGCN